MPACVCVCRGGGGRLLFLITVRMADGSDLASFTSSWLRCGHLHLFLASTSSLPLSLSDLHKVLVEYKAGALSMSCTWAHADHDDDDWQSSSVCALAQGQALEEKVKKVFSLFA